MICIGPPGTHPFPMTELNGRFHAYAEEPDVAADHHENGITDNVAIPTDVHVICLLWGSTDRPHSHSAFRRPTETRQSDPVPA
jgi:hypothetical protein